MFNLFKKKEKKVEKPQVKIQNADNEKKIFDYFAFSFQTNLQEMKLVENPLGMDVRLENDVLNVYRYNQIIGTGDNTAKNKFIQNCAKKWVIHSFVVYANGRAKVRIKFFY